MSDQVVDSPDEFLTITEKCAPAIRRTSLYGEYHPSRKVAAQPVPSSPAQLDARYCSAVVVTRNTYDSTINPVNLIPGTTDDIASALRD